MRKIYLILLAYFIFASNNLYAVPAYPNPIEVAQPDGTTLTITLKGDEFVSWAESADGFTLLRNSDGFFEYAQKNVQGDLALSGRIAKNIQQRTAADNAFLQQIPVRLGFSSSQVAAFSQIRQARKQALETTAQRAPSQSDAPQRSIIGTIRIPLILVDFPNKTFTRTASEFQMLCNQLNYTVNADGIAITGSVRDYFKASSYNQLDVQIDVFGPFRMSNNIAYYDDEIGGDPRLMAREAAIAASAAGCNFALYDSNNSGEIDGMHIIYAGYDQSAGEPAGQGIWAHAWSINGTALNLNGKRVRRYSCSSELRNNSSASVANRDKITHIGVICHELGHVFGLPDLYDTDYSGSGGTSVHIDRWCLMASGSWNNSGITPPYLSAWCRAEMGWVQTTMLTDPADITIPNPAIQGACYRINTTTANEYFLLENRQQQSWDQYVPASGLLIYHVDRNYSGWNNNCINCSPSHRGLYIKQAGGGAGSTSFTRTTDPYPQGTNNSFTDTSVPNSKSWAGNNTNKPVTDIVHNTVPRTITFAFMGGAVSCPRPTNISANNITTSSANIQWTAGGAETSWRFRYKKQSETNFSNEIVINTTPTYNLSNLDINTEYNIEIKAICIGEESTAQSFTFKTLCGIVSTFPWTETFENNSPTRDCWTQSRVSGTVDWLFGTGISNVPANSTTYAYFYNASYTAHTTRLISPVLQLNSSNLFKLSFDMANRAWSSDINQLKVYYRTSTTSAWVLIETYTAANENWATKTINLPNPYATYQIAFEGINKYGRPLAIDNVKVIEEIPLCDNQDKIIYTITSHDAYGDGWNGSAALIVKQNDEIVATIKNTSAHGTNYITSIVPLCPCEPFELIWIKGTYDYECSFVVKDNNDDVVFATPAGTYSSSTAGCAGYSNNQVVFSDTTNCVSQCETYNHSEDVSVCNYASYIFPDNTTISNITSSFSHTSNLTSVAGCDSIVVTNVSITFADLSVTLVDGVLIANQANAEYQWLMLDSDDWTDFGGMFLIEDATEQSFTPTAIGYYGYYGVRITYQNCVFYSETKQVIIPCQTIYSNFEETFCEGDAYSFYCADCPDLSNLTAGTYVFYATLPATNGCDSIITLTINVLSKFTSEKYDTIFENETYSGQTYELFGDYELIDTLTAINSCDSIVTTHLHVQQTSGINETEFYNIKIYPNPAKDQLFIINNEQLKIKSVEILDVTGKTLISLQPLDSLNPTINVSSLPKGVYFIKIQFENSKIFFEKFIKE